MHPLGHMTVAVGTVWIGSRLLGRSSDAARQMVNRIDYRLVLLGSLLPDLIDKPLAWFLLHDYLNGNGHTYGHTLLAALVVVLPGLLLAVRWRDPRFLAMGMAMLSHLAVDPTNHSLENLLWPLLGTEFPQVTLLGSNMTVLTEAISAMMLLSAGYFLYSRNKLQQFIQEGRIDQSRS